MPTVADGPAISAQLPLGVRLRDEATLDNFCRVDSVAPAAAAIESALGGLDHGLIYLHGPADSGRSHLLQSVCHQAPAGEALYLPLSEMVPVQPEELLANIEGMRWLCLDDVQSIAGQTHWEEQLFHLYNRCLTTGTQWLVAGDQPPLGIGLGLADLASRLASGALFQLPRFSDSEKAVILTFRARQRGMELTTDVAQYILQRAPRGLTELMGILDRLDRESMVAQRRLSIPFVRQTLGW